MIRACEQAGAVTIAAEGTATMTESPAVHAAAIDRVLGGARRLRVDLRDCTALDSTFLGTLLALKTQVERVGGSLVLVSPSRAVVSTLRQMGLEDFYDIEIADRAPGPWKDIAAARPGIEQLRRLVVDAHDELARRPGPASNAFREVAEELRHDAPAPSQPRSTPGRPSGMLDTRH
jgi:anti-sigma B factor antagonist